MKVNSDLDADSGTKLLSSIGLAKKAGKLTIGTEAVCDEVRAHNIKLVVASGLASDNTKKRITDCAKFYRTKTVFISVTPDALGAAIGKTATACVGIADDNFIKLIERNLTESV